MLGFSAYLLIPEGLIFRIQLQLDKACWYKSFFMHAYTYNAGVCVCAVLSHYSRWENLVALNTSADGWTDGHDGKAMKISHVKL